MDILEYLITTVPLFHKINTLVNESLVLFNEYFWYFLAALIVLSVLYLAIKIGLLWYRMQQLKKQSTVLLELIPPSVTNQEAYTTEQLFTLIHALGGRGTLLNRLLGIKPTFSLEIVSTKYDGIRYLIRTSIAEAETLKQNLLSYLPQLVIRETSDYSSENKDQNHKLIELALARHFAYPLREQSELDEHDPIAYITGMMTKLMAEDLIALQIVLSPIVSKEAHRISQLALSNHDIARVIENEEKNKAFAFLPVLRFFVFVVSFVLAIPAWLLGNIATEGNTPFPIELFPPTNKFRQETVFEKDVTNSIYTKSSQPLFEASIRLYVKSGSAYSAENRLRGIISSFSSFNSAQGQRLVPKRSWLSHLLIKQLDAFKYRLPSLRPMLLSVSEVSNLYHFPHTRITKTEDIVKSHSKQLPAPLTLKRASNLDVLFAKNTYGGVTTEIGLTEEERRRHMYIIGATGTGKSTLLHSMIVQDINNGKGLCVIDPHGDLIEKILPTIPEKRLRDVVYFNPDDTDFPVGLNLLELSEGLSGEELLREKDYITESIISIFHKLYPERYSGPRMEYVLRNTIHTAFTIEHPTFFTIYDLLVDDKFRKKVTAQLTDKKLSNFWKYEFNKAGDYQKIKMIGPITNKIGRFLFSETARRVLEQEKSTINLDDIMDHKKILLCNFSKGRIGEDASEMFGILLMAKIQLAALKRARTEESKRQDFYLYVDEFQNFATQAFSQVLSESRKYRLSAILAHQTVSQLEDQSLVNVTLANTGSIICFRTANPKDEQLILPQFYPYIEPGEIANLPSFHFYMKISAIEPEEPFSGETVPASVRTNPTVVASVIEHSRQHYARKYEPEQEVAETPKTEAKQIKKPRKKTTQAVTSVSLPLLNVE